MMEVGPWTLRFPVEPCDRTCTVERVDVTFRLIQQRFFKPKLVVATNAVYDAAFLLKNRTLQPTYKLGIVVIATMCRMDGAADLYNILAGSYGFEGEEPIVRRAVHFLLVCGPCHMMWQIVVPFRRTLTDSFDWLTQEQPSRFCNRR